MGLNEILQLFFAGLALGNGPCLAFCLPVLLPYIAVGQGAVKHVGAVPGWKKGLNLSIMFSIGRLFSYAIMGVLSVLVYRLVSSFISGGTTDYLRVATGILVLGAGVSALVKSESNKFCRIIQRVSFGKIEINMITIGILIGFAPCLPLYGALGYLAAMSPNVLMGLAGGVSFGLGTVISPLIPLGIFSGFVSEKMLKNEKVFFALRIISGLILLILGLRLILIPGMYIK